MRDGVRVTMGAAWHGGSTYVPAGSVGIVGASNVPWRLDINYRRATVGTTARAALQFGGSVSGGEWFDLLIDNATPVDWTRGGGTCTPLYADQTYYYVMTGAAANLDDCDFGEPTVIKNRTFANLAWRRVATFPAPAASTTTPSLLVVNTRNYVYNPLRGRQRIVVGGFQGTSGAVFLGFGLAGTAGSLMLSYNAGQLILRIWDAATALVAALNCGAVNANRHVFDVLWDSQSPLRGIAGAYMAVVEGGTILGSGGTAWTPPTADVTPLGFGCDSGSANAARCFIEEC
jgi:hypothetical protein